LIEDDESAKLIEIEKNGMWKEAVAPDGRIYYWYHIVYFLF
jgi:hypothetical protein